MESSTSILDHSLPSNSTSIDLGQTRQSNERSKLLETYDDDEGDGQASHATSRDILVKTESPSSSSPLSLAVSQAEASISQSSIECSNLQRSPNKLEDQGVDSGDVNEQISISKTEPIAPQITIKIDQRPINNQQPKPFLSSTPSKSQFHAYNYINGFNCNPNSSFPSGHLPNNKNILNQHSIQSSNFAAHEFNQYNQHFLPDINQSHHSINSRYNPFSHSTFGSSNHSSVLSPSNNEISQSLFQQNNLSVESGFWNQSPSPVGKIPHNKLDRNFVGSQFNSIFNHSSIDMNTSSMMSNTQSLFNNTDTISAQNSTSHASNLANSFADDEARECVNCGKS